MGTLFHLALTQPLFNLLVVLYKYVTVEDLGLAIILLTVIVRLLLYPVFYKGLKSQTLIQKIQPEVQRVQKQFKDDKQKQAEQLMALYKENKVNPFSSLLYVLIQLPILIAVYRIFFHGLTTDTFTNLYSFVSAPATVSHIFLGVIDIAKPSIVIVVIAALAQYWQSRLSIAKQSNQGQSGMQRAMVYMAPLLTLLVLPRLSAAVGLYWATSALFSVAQQYLINKQLYGANNPTRTS